MKEHHFRQFMADYRDRLEHMRLYDMLLTATASGQCTPLVTIYRFYGDLWPVLPASTGAHQAWPGGLRDHMASICRFGWRDYRADKGLLVPLPYSWDAFVVAAFCHDAEKIPKFASPHDSRFRLYHEMHGDGVGWEDIKWLLIAAWEREFGLVIDADIRNAITYTHGEGADYRKGERVMGALAAAVGNADRKSARIYPFEGRGRG